MSQKIARWGWTVLALLLAAVQIPVLVKSAGDPTQSDFANYFTPAFVLARGGDLGALYGRDGFAKAMTEAGLTGLGSFVPHPPANALWLLPLAGLPPGAAKSVWTIVLICSILGAVWAVNRLAPGVRPSLATVLVLGPTLAVRNGLAFGQPYLILTSLLLVGVLALQHGSLALAGFLLGFGASFKPYALAIGVLFVHRDRRRLLAGFACGALGPSSALWMLTGAQPFIEFASKVLPWMARGDIQDPFSPGWGSLLALVNRFLRCEPDLNPQPWVHAPIAARFVGAAISAALLILGLVAARKALDAGKATVAVAIGVAFSLCASPYVASYHLVLLVLPVLAVAHRLRAASLGIWLIFWALLGSPLVNMFRSVPGILAPLAFIRLFGLLAVAFVIAWPFLDRLMLRRAVGLGAIAGVLALPWGRSEEAWERVSRARGYSMANPHFCGAHLRWWAPSADGHGLESRGEGFECGTAAASIRGDERVTSRFTHGSWNLYLDNVEAGGASTRLTFSDANEIDPTFSPDGCSLFFASDQGRGLGSTALYRLDIATVSSGCGKVGLASARRRSEQEELPPRPRDADSLQPPGRR
ncbi:MAG: DUF2029 domain-containing protein [Vicinamibacteria bacterium]|nr:DUF2029 domain-containing protein [Vicinamibacteria bacterium]